MKKSYVNGLKSIRRDFIVNKIHLQCNCFFMLNSHWRKNVPGALKRATTRVVIRCHRKTGSDATLRLCVSVSWALNSPCNLVINRPKKKEEVQNLTVCKILYTAVYAIWRKSLKCQIRGVLLNYTHFPLRFNSHWNCRGGKRLAFSILSTYDSKVSVRVLAKSTLLYTEILGTIQNASSFRVLHSVSRNWP